MNDNKYDFENRPGDRAQAVNSLVRGTRVSLLVALWFWLDEKRFPNIIVKVFVRFEFIFKKTNHFKVEIKKEQNIVSKNSFFSPSFNISSLSIRKKKVKLNNLTEFQNKRNAKVTTCHR